MYDPVKDGVEKSVQAVSYAEVAPPEALSELVHCYWELKTDEHLPEDFTLHALPDACTNILFDQLDTRICGVTALQTTYTALNLGRRFHLGRSEGCGRAGFLPNRLTKTCVVRGRQR